MVRWYNVTFTSARPFASCASKPPSISVCVSGRMNMSPARLPGKYSKETTDGSGSIGSELGAEQRLVPGLPERGPQLHFVETAERAA